MPDEPDDRGHGGEQRVRDFPDSPDYDIRDVVVAVQGSSTSFPRRHATRMRNIKKMTGTAVKTVTTVRSARMGDIGASYLAVSRCEQADLS